ncbi:unnamed protein product [Rotaria sordida]|uniref:Uncharacterized protein n=1 Tax=Rotaria sordida TaxID=392033 RepID=A0A819X3W1_9BILA|nr:unnamed protein product [Rotaria sordida]CAF1441901.1 unnamed protein product [Rotaria sordida]CAF3689254.1 unnamed protein product [Rotaria sordida]CAF4134736.1 unnamed protein product [Rotaria sordida]
MNCRSLSVVSRFVKLSSNIGDRCIIGSYNNQFIYFDQQSNRRYLGKSSSDNRRPSRIRRFLRWFGWGAQPIVSSLPPPPPPTTTMQKTKRFLLISPSIERFLLRSYIIEDEDLARLLSKTAAVVIYAMFTVTTLGTLGVDTKPLLAGIGITGFTIGFALKEVATNFISGIFLVINKPFVRGCRIKIHGTGGGIEGLVHFIDIRYVHLKTKDRGMIMVPSAIVYTNAFTVFSADDEANIGFMDMTKPPISDPTKQPQTTTSLPPSNISSSKEKNLKMIFDTEPVGSFKKSSFNKKL